MTDFKPGDIAKVTIGKNIYTAIRTRYYGREYLEEGFWQSGEYGRLYRESEHDLRPLVVIDPEDREQVEQLFNAIDKAEDDTIDDPETADAWAVNAVQAALRSMVEPPSVPEPQNFLAAIEDRGGATWVRQADGNWRSLSSDGQYVVVKHWNDNLTPLEGNVAKVLFAGVTS